MRAGCSRTNCAMQTTAPKCRTPTRSELWIARMLRIKFSPGEAVDVEGTATDFLALRSRIFGMIEAGETEVTQPVDISFDPLPYESFLAGIEVRASNINRVSVVNQLLVITGNESFLNNLAMNLPCKAEQPSSGVQFHVHYDRISFGDFLDDDSMDLILSVRRQES